MIIKLKKLLESKVSNYFIKIGEKIEILEKELNQLIILFSKIQDKKTLEQLNNIKNSLFKIKKKISNMYPF